MPLLSVLLLLFGFTLIAGNTSSGSNNRANVKRRFDSQNNKDGGYNIGDRYNRPAGNDVNKQYPMQYFMSDPGSSQGKGVSVFPIEWTNQHAEHGCLHCSKVLQFMCKPVHGNHPGTVPDRTLTSTNTYSRKPRNNGNSQERVRGFQRRKRRINQPIHRGMNEPAEWRDKCAFRPRNNKELFTSEQKEDKSTHTRQSPQRESGYECPEERDHYPHWLLSDWKDIAYLPEDPALCISYIKESFNVKPKHVCRETFLGSTEDLPFSPANNKEQCDQRGGTWTLLHSYLEKLPLGKDDCEAMSDTTWGHAIYGNGQKECLLNVPGPDCKAAALTRVNHIGNSEDGKGGKYMWKLPHFPSGQTQKCVYRLRYISTEDYDPYNTNSKSNNADNVVENDPKIDVGLDGGQKLQLAHDTAQTFQTFQERSRVFLIKPRDTTFGDENLHGVEKDVKNELLSVWNKIQAKLQQLIA